MTKTRDELYMGPVEVITSVARRRRRSPEEKKAMVIEKCQNKGYFSS
jgi:hypothetical protein